MLATGLLVQAEVLQACSKHSQIVRAMMDVALPATGAVGSHCACISAASLAHDALHDEEASAALAAPRQMLYTPVPAGCEPGRCSHQM